MSRTAHVLPPAFSLDSELISLKRYGVALSLLEINESQVIRLRHE